MKTLENPFGHGPEEDSKQPEEPEERDHEAVINRPPSPGFGSFGGGTPSTPYDQTNDDEPHFGGSTGGFAAAVAE